MVNPTAENQQAEMNYSYYLYTTFSTYHTLVLLLEISYLQRLGKSCTGSKQILFYMLKDTKLRVFVAVVV